MDDFGALSWCLSNHYGAELRSMLLFIVHTFMNVPLKNWH
ncbi:hypothetical protein GAPWKB30_1185 [Gilliamella apicola]|nr:hypothetical protein GAPWKB30_1185 [Gilliamella apicola]